MDDDEPRAGEVTTPNYNWTLPTVGASDDAWGNYLNSDLLGIDSIVHSIDIRPSGVTISDTAPASPAVGALWWDSVGGQLYTFYNDGNSSQWVTASNATASLLPASTTVLGGVKVDGTTIKAATDGTISTVYIPINPNRLDNGDMWVDQHNSGVSVAIPAATYRFITDRWQMTNTKAKFTAGQNYSVATKAPSFPYFFGVQTTGTGAAPAAADLNFALQSIEFDSFGDFNWGTANAQPATLSFWVNSSLTGNFSASLSGNVSPYRVFITTYNIPTANTWTKITIPIPADTTVSATNWTGAGNAAGLAVTFDLGSGANVQTSTNLGAWQNNATVFVASGAVKLVATSNAKFAITGVKLEAGSVATPFNRQSLAKSMADCQRYYQIRSVHNVGGVAANSTGINWGYGFPVVMRAAPTVTFSMTGGSGYTAGSPGQIAPDGFTANATGTATGYVANVSWNASAEL